MISSDPDDTEMNELVRDVFRESLFLSGLLCVCCDLCDRRSGGLSREEIGGYDVIVLSGGHVPTENRFFREIGLREKLCGFDGIVIGISAGSMNSAEVVYAQPELEGEASDPEYSRFLSGLGLTDLMILPHYQDVRDTVLDGMRVMEDITYPDSVGRRFYALVDGSYITVSEGGTTLHGEAWLIENGGIRKICEEDEQICLTRREE